jgi:glucosamine-6-phosphate deaminase
VRIPSTIFADPAALGRVLAGRIAGGIAAARAADRPYVLGCPGGRTPLSTFAELARVVAARRLDLRHVVIAMMDEYLVAGGGPPVDDALPHSCRRFGQRAIVAPLSAAAGDGRGITGDRFWVPDPAAPDSYDRRLAELGGVDLFVLACGASDGHVGFNPPGSSPHSPTRIVTLAETTRRDNLATFPALGSLDQVPRYGVTVGIGTIRRLSRSAVMVVHGAVKAEAAARLRGAERFDPRWPATVVTECRNPALFIDRAAVTPPIKEKGTLVDL